MVDSSRIAYTIIGTGWMGRALGGRLMDAGSRAQTANNNKLVQGSSGSDVRVVYGSRRPDEDKGFPLAGPVLSIRVRAGRTP